MFTACSASHATGELRLEQSCRRKNGRSFSVWGYSHGERTTVMPRVSHRRTPTLGPSEPQPKGPISSACMGPATIACANPEKGSRVESDERTLHHRTLSGAPRDRETRPPAHLEGGQMSFPTEAEYYAERAMTCRAAQAAASDQASAYAHGQLAARYDACSQAASMPQHIDTQGEQGEPDER